MKYLTPDEVFSALSRLSELGHARVLGGQLYTQMDAHADWLCLGAVRDPDDTREYIDHWFRVYREGR